MMDYKNRNILVMAYIGDAIYEIYVRKFLIDKGIEKVNELQKEATKYVSARGQAKYLRDMLDQTFFVEEEMHIILRARNHKIKSSPKNTDIITYKYATALESIIGYLYLTGNNQRIDEIMKYIIDKEI
jgi:ribonuclease-3 family protein